MMKNLKITQQVDKKRLSRISEMKFMRLFDCSFLYFGLMIQLFVSSLPFRK